MKLSLSQQTPNTLIITVDSIPADVMAAIHPPNNEDLAETDGYPRASFGKEIGRPSRSLTVSSIGYISKKRFAVN